MSPRWEGDLVLDSNDNSEKMKVIIGIVKSWAEGWKENQEITSVKCARAHYGLRCATASLLHTAGPKWSDKTATAHHGCVAWKPRVFVKLGLEHYEPQVARSLARRKRASERADRGVTCSLARSPLSPSLPPSPSKRTNSPLAHSLAFTLSSPLPRQTNGELARSLAHLSPPHQKKT